MKKFFTLVFGVLFAMCANAATLEIGEPSNNVKDGDNVWYDAATKTITFFEKWSYRPGWWLNSKDCSDYDEFVLEVENPDQVTIQVVVEYEATDEAGKTISSIAQGHDAKITVPLNADYKKVVRQIYLQCADDAPKSVTFKNAYFQNAVELSEVELTLVEGHTILASEFDKYADDTKIKLSFENQTDPYESRKGWGIGGFANSDNWTPTFNISAADGKAFDVMVTVGDFKKAAKNGTDSYVDGQYHKAGVTFNIYNQCKLVGAYILLEKDPSSGISNATILTPAKSTKIYNLAGQQVDASYKGVVIKNGKKFVQ
ncbi:hypothetical protein ONT17_05735 [Prevotella copri]|uniref:hypothetical protein n=1 Tax=Segatella copri TaxID=165179 RepID=UPI0022327C39|nr:hypothetical protein [Segatella copri]MCW4118253.1 hypothetical protein [Segatella copri]